MAIKIMIPFGGMQLIEKKLIALNTYASQPTIRRALRGEVPKRSKQKEYKLIRAITLEIGGMEIKSK